jgi:excinuclease ABC subunit C
LSISYKGNQREGRLLAIRRSTAAKTKLEMLDLYRSKSFIVNSGIKELDVFSWDETENAAFINYMHVHKGCIVQTYTFEYRKKNRRRQRISAGKRYI